MMKKSYKNNNTKIGVIKQSLKKIFIPCQRVILHSRAKPRSITLCRIQYRTSLVFFSMMILVAMAL